MSDRHALLRRIYAEGHRVRVSLGEGDVTFEMVHIWRFRGDAISHVWSLHDALPWLQAPGIVPSDEEIERGLEEALVTRRRRSPPA